METDNPLDTSSAPAPKPTEDVEANPGGPSTGPRRESLVGDAEVLGVEILRTGSAQTPDLDHLLDVEKLTVDATEEEGPAPSTSRNSSLRRFLSRRSSSFSAASHRSRPSTSSRISRASTLRFSFRRSRCRPGDIEEARIACEVDGTELYELDGATPGPFELCGLSHDERQRLLSAKTEYVFISSTKESVFNFWHELGRNNAHLRLAEALFGDDMCSPRYHTLRQVYMQQVDEKLEASRRKGAVINPNTKAWPESASFLVSHLGLVARNFRPDHSITSFVQSNIDVFQAMIRDGDILLPDVDRLSGGRIFVEGVPEAGNDLDKVFAPRYQRMLDEWMLFALESWFMIEISPLPPRHNLIAAAGLTSTSLHCLLSDFVPKESSNNTPHTTITPSELSASMLQDWHNIRFIWTRNLKDHLIFDRRCKTVALYSNVAFAHLHSLAGSSSSFHVSGFTQYQRTLTEISSSLRLLFGSNTRSKSIFSSLQSTSPHPSGYYDLFGHLQHHDTEPRYCYSFKEDFPVYGERLALLKDMLKPKGLSGLWRDKRDSLQWWTFWALVAFGTVGIMLALFQAGVGAVQAYASMVQLKTGTQAARNP